MRMRMTRRGYLFLLAVVFVTIPSYLMSHSLLFLLTGFFMGIVVYNAVFVWLNMRRIQIRANIVGEWTAGSPGTIAIQVRAARRAFDVTFGAETDHAHVHDLRVDNLVDETEIKLKADKFWRGKLEVNRVYAESSYPFGFISYRVSDDRQHQVTVLPWVLPLEFIESELSHDSGGAMPISSGDYQYLDDYRAGEDVRLVHWKKSASRHQLVMRRDMRRRSDPHLKVFVPDDCAHLEYAIALVSAYVVDPESAEAWGILDGTQIIRNDENNRLYIHLATVSPSAALNDLAFEQADWQWIEASKLTPNPHAFEEFERIRSQALVFQESSDE